MKIDHDKVKKMSNLERSDIYNKLKEFVTEIAEDIQSGAARRGSPEYRILQESMREAERDMYYLQLLMNEDNQKSGNTS